MADAAVAETIGVGLAHRSAELLGRLAAELHQLGPGGRAGELERFLRDLADEPGPSERDDEAALRRVVAALELPAWQVDLLVLASLPDHHEDDPLPGRERFYGQNPLDPRRWLRVVVDFNELPGWIVTVLVQDNDPRGTQR